MSAGPRSHPGIEVPDCCRGGSRVVRPKGGLGVSARAPSHLVSAVHPGRRRRRARNSQHWAVGQRRRGGGHLPSVPVGYHLRRFTTRACSLRVAQPGGIADVRVTRARRYRIRHPRVVVAAACVSSDASGSVTGLMMVSLIHVPRNEGSMPRMTATPLSPMARWRGEGRRA